MPVHNSEIAGMFDHLADLLEIEGANRFRVRAYRSAADTIRDQSREVADMLEDGEDLSEPPGIGEDLAGKIAEIVETGRLPLLEETAEDVPEGMREATRIPGIGPKRARALFEALEIDTLENLKAAAEDGQVAEIDGSGPKTQAKIREALESGEIGERRIRLDTAAEFAEPLVDWLREVEGVRRAEVAGSYRRRKETVGDLDIVAAGEDGEAIIGRFVEYDEIEEVASKGRTRATVRLRSGLQVDLRVVAEESWGAALHDFTGAKAHAVAMRKRAQGRDLKLNEYGLFDGDERVAGETEEGLFEGLGLPWIDPVLRESRGEIEAAEAGELPELVTLDDIRGDLHAHTTASDGRNSLREMAEAAKERGCEYLAITDHSRSQTQAGGLSVEEVEAQIEEIEALNAELDGVRLLKATEVDILEDGSLDFPDALLDKLDVVVASVHGRLDLDAEAQTERIIRAMDNPRVNVIGHPTARLIGERRGMALDIERLAEAAAERGCALELNANPMRLDPRDVHCRLAVEAGARIAISTDAHSVGGLGNMRHGVDQARRGWLGAADVINTRSWPELSKLLRR